MIWAILFIIFAGIVRGYTGFGFSVIAVLCLSFLYSPVEAIVMAITLDLLSSLCLLSGIKQGINKQLLKPLIIGMLISIPPALYFISIIPAQELKIMIAGLSFIAGGLIMLNLKAAWLNEHYALGVGVLSGFTMTTASAGGPPLILYLMNLSLDPKELRSTSIIFFIVSALVSLIGLLNLGVVDPQIFWKGAVLLPVAFIGNLMGKKLYLAYPHIPARWSTAPILMALAALSFIF